MSRLFLSALLLLSFATSAQAQLIPDRVKLMMEARYAELQKLAEKEVAETPGAPSSRLMFLCLSYSKLKQYNLLFPCLDQLEGNIARGDTAANDLDEMRRNSPILFGMAMMGSAVVGGPEGLKGNVTPFLHLMRAEAYTELRDYDKAIAAAKKAEAAIPKQWNEERYFRIQALTALGMAHAFAGKTDEARKYAETLQALSTSYPYSKLTDDKVTGVAKNYLAIGDYRKAYDGLRSDSEVFGKMLDVVMPLAHLVTGGETMRISWVYMEMPKKFMAIKTQLEVGEIKEAKVGYDELLAVPEARDNGEIYWLLLYDRGRIAAMEKDYDAAVEFWKKAAEVIEQQRSTINTEANKIGFVGDKQDVYKQLIAGLFAQQKYDEAFEYLERSKSRALVDMLASKKDFAVATGNADQINALLAKADATEFAARAQVVPDAAQRNLAIAPPVQQLREQAPELASLVSVTSISTADIQALVPAGEAIVEYYYDDANLMAFVLTQQGLQAAKLDVTGLEANIRELRDAIEDVNSERYLPYAQALYKQLIAPLDPMLGDNKLILVPHGAMHYLPFAVLHDGNAFLIEKHALRLLPSASVIKYLRATRPIKPAGILAFGNPDLGDPRYDLRYAQDEAIAVAKMLPASKALIRKEATEAAFQKFAPGFNYIHFATHGEFDAEAPLDSSLLLAADGNSDGRLTVGKLYSSRIDADLVTLSACETGLGKVASGDDVVGLTRGFLYAGASTIVASLWKVDDLATAQLMSAFYRGLSQGDKREALRQAQLETRKQFPHPYYWAAFQLTGNAL